MSGPPFLFNSLPACSSFNYRPLLSSNKTKHSPLIFKYPKTPPNKITLYHPFSISKLEPFPLLFFLFSSSLLCTRHCPLVPAAPKQNKTLSSTLLLDSVLMIRKKKKPDHDYLSSCFLKINHSGICFIFRFQDLELRPVSFQFSFLSSAVNLHLFFVSFFSFFFFFFSTIYT